MNIKYNIGDKVYVIRRELSYVKVGDDDWHKPEDIISETKVAEVQASNSGVSYDLELTDMQESNAISSVYTHLVNQKDLYGTKEEAIEVAKEYVSKKFQSAVIKQCADLDQRISRYLNKMEELKTEAEEFKEEALQLVEKLEIGEEK